MPLAQRPLRIGLVGYGFMGRAHSNAYKRVGDFFDLEYRPVLQAVCGRNHTKVSEFAQSWGFESIETDWKALVERPDIDVVDIAAPNDSHAQIAVAAAEADKMILCEKPLARTVAEAEQMVEAAERARVANMVWYNYR